MPAVIGHPRRQTAALVTVAAVLAACATFVDGPTRVVVDGVTYDLIVLSQDDLRLSRDDLSVAGEVDVPQELEYQFADLTAYSLDGVDPRGFLLTPRVPGLDNDAEPYADYFGLRGPGTSVPAVCAYFAPGRLDGC